MYALSDVQKKRERIVASLLPIQLAQCRQNGERHTYLRRCPLDAQLVKYIISTASGAPQVCMSGKELERIEQDYKGKACESVFYFFFFTLWVPQNNGIGSCIYRTLQLCRIRCLLLTWRSNFVASLHIVEDLTICLVGRVDEDKTG